MRARSALWGRWHPMCAHNQVIGPGGRAAFRAGRVRRHAVTMHRTVDPVRVWGRARGTRMNQTGRREDGKTGRLKTPTPLDQSAQPDQRDPSHIEPSSSARLPASPSSLLRALRRFAGWGMLALVLLVGLSGCGLGTDENPYTHIDPATDVANDIQGLYKTLFYMATVVFVLVQFLILYTALRYRRKKRSTGRPAQVHGNSRLEITWTIIPAVVLLVILVPTISILYSLDADAEDDEGAMIVEVYGKQWWWELHYPGMGADESQPLVTANEVRLPVDQKVIFRLQSNNVIHSFWVPQ